jgi:TatD DNase family protein
MVDSHCHLESHADEGLDVDSLLDQVAANRIGGILDVGVVPSTLKQRQDHFGGRSFVRTASGLHPGSLSTADTAAEIDLLRTQVATGRLVAVGEIGLDFHWGDDNREQQLEALEAQIRIALGADLPVVLHNRDADDEILSVLREYRPRGVMHCFEQSVQFCRACLDLGMYVSFAGNVTFKKAEQIREAARMVPEDRLLVETDAPVLSPVPVRGRPNHSGHLGFVIDVLAGIRSSTSEQITRITATNAATLFALSAWRVDRS